MTEAEVNLMEWTYWGIDKSSGKKTETRPVEKRKRPPALTAAFSAFPQALLLPGCLSKIVG